MNRNVPKVCLVFPIFLSPVYYQVGFYIQGICFKEKYNYRTEKNYNKNVLEMLFKNMYNATA